MEKQVALFQGHTHVWKTLLSFIDSMVLRCAVELGLADVIHAKGHPLSSSQIAKLLSPPPTNPSTLALGRIMRFLAYKGIFTAAGTHSITGETLYSTNPSSDWLVQGSKGSLASMVLLKTFPVGPTPWHSLAECVRRGGTAFELACGVNFWSFTTTHPDLDNIFNDAMACTIANTLGAVISSYKEVFVGLESIVDVGGGTGAALGEITRLFPGLCGINFDRPHVVAEAAEFPGVIHVGGDMFKSIPPADAMFLKWILHCFGDEECVRILKNCRGSIPEKTGKIIIMESVLNPYNHEDPLEDIRMAYDIVMLTNQSGKERTEKEWKTLLDLAGFPKYKIIPIPAITSIIEAYPE